MIKQYVDKESYLSMGLRATTNLKLGQTCHPFTHAKSTLSPKSEILAWQGSPHKVLNVLGKYPSHSDIFYLNICDFKDGPFKNNYFL